MTRAEFKAELDDFLSTLEWQDNATYEMELDDSYGDDVERWRADLKTDSSFYPERVLSIVETPWPKECDTKLAIESGEDCYLDLEPQWFFGWMWITAELDLRTTTEERDKESARASAMAELVKTAEARVKKLEALLPYLDDGCGCSHMSDDGIPGKCIHCQARDLMKGDDDG